MDNEILKLISCMYRKKTLWLFLLSIVTAIVALWAMQSGFGIDGGPRATYFLCFCVSFSAYQVVVTINKSTELLSDKKSAKKDKPSNSITEADVKICKHCGKQLTDGANFCTYCGAEQKPD